MKYFAAAALLASATAFTPETVTFEQLNAGGIAVHDQLLAGLSTEGLISVTGVPGFKEMKARVLAAASACALSQKDSEDSFQFDFEDGTKRFTLATKTEDNSAHQIQGADMAHAACAEFGKLEGEFRELVDATVEKFVTELDGAQGTGRRVLLAEKSGANAVSSFAGIKDSGVQLEHFHTYMRSESEQDMKNTLDVHVDQGLFIALTPALMVENNKVVEGASHGFTVQLSSGEIVEPNLADTDLLFMIGDGVTQWLNPNLDTKLRATPHAMKMTEGAAVRSWYGRMILPGKDKYLPTQGKTFGDIIKQSQSRNLSEQQDLASSACSYGFELVSRNLQSCGAGQILCWHQCMAASCSNAVCISGNTGQPCSGHDGSCAPQC